MVIRKLNKRGKASCFSKNKQGQGHVEIMLSFVLFVGALIFLFLFINPFAKTDEVSIINEIQKTIINEISLDIGKLSIITNDTFSCYEFRDIEYPGNYKEVSEADRKYNIYFGEIFDNSALKKSCLPQNYTLGNFFSEKMIVYEKVQNLVIDYNTDYEELKKSLGISEDFIFSFKTLVNNEISELSVSKQIPTGVDVEAKEFPVRVINSNAEIQELILNIRAWR